MNKPVCYCSFCGKSQYQVRKLVAAPAVFICDTCVDLCHEIVHDEPHQFAAFEARMTVAMQPGLSA